SVDAQIQRLEDEADEALAKVLRANKQKKLLYARKQRMIAAGLNSLEELDAAEELERKEKERERKEQREKEAARLAALPIPTASDPFPDLVLDPAFLETLSGDPEMWATLGFGDGTPEVPPSTG
ncbi:hypothetical protein HYALB_00014078, partial [Hymenoscyphus albidus]